MCVNERLYLYSLACHTCCISIFALVGISGIVTRIRSEVTCTITVHQCYLRPHRGCFQDSFTKEVHSALWSIIIDIRNIHLNLSNTLKSNVDKLVI